MKSQLRYLKARLYENLGKMRNVFLKLLCREEPEMKLYKNIYPIWLS